MKNLFKYIFVAAALVISSAVASAQSKYSDAEKAAIKVSKNVEGPAKDGSFTLTLDTFVAGDFVSETTSASKPSDIVLVLDMSGSMGWPMSGTPTQTRDNNSTIYANWQADSKSYYIRDNQRYRYIYDIKKNGNTYTGYYGTGSSTPSSFNLSNYTIYEGKPSRIQALKQGVKAFLKIIKDQTSATVPNQISIVTFSSSGRSSVVTRDKNALNDYASLVSAVDNLVASGGTYVNEGLQKAKTILDGVTRPSEKSVIFFTDGEAEDTKSTIYNTAATLKNSSVTIYSIGAFAANEATSTVKSFLSQVSSNYDGNKQDTGKTEYSIIASSVEDLQTAFEKAAGGVSPKGGQGINVPADKITIKDIVTSKFVLPNGASDVTVKMVPVKVVTVPATATAASYVPQWGSPVDAEGVTADVVDSGLTDEDGNALKSIDVKGFDFSAHWVGLDRIEVDGRQTAAAVHADGAKLQIKIKIVPDPNDVGGEVKTNDDRSGFYFDDETAPLQNYTTPGAVFVPMDMDIILNGLDADESALFKVYRYNKDADGKDTDEKEYIMTVALTGESSATTVSKLPIVDYIKDKTDPALIHESAITYVVECDSNWSWKYDITPSETADQGAQHALYKRTSGGVFTSTNKYVFNAVKTPTDGKGTAGKYIYDESSENNVFNRVTK